MRVIKAGRGFRQVRHKTYPGGTDGALVQESSAVGEYVDSLEKPGSSYLWVGTSFHLDREEVGQLIKFLSRWLKTGRLSKQK